MGRAVKIKASVISHVGNMKFKNDDNFYMNGRYVEDFVSENVQLYVEKASDNFVFSVSDSMDLIDEENKISISMTNDVKKFHEKLKGSGKSLQESIQDLSSILKDTNNLIDSINIDKEEKQPSFVSLVIKEDRVTVLCLGNCKGFIIRNGIINQLTVDWEKTERLLNLGIITDEQATDLSDRFGIPTKESINDILESDEFELEEGDIFILTTKGITNNLGNEDIKDAFKNDQNIDTAANSLVTNALNMESNENITITAIKIDRIYNRTESNTTIKKYKRKYFLKKPSLAKASQYFKNFDFKKLDTKKLYTVLTAILLIFTVVFGVSALIKNKAASKANKPNPSITTQDNNGTLNVDKENTLSNGGDNVDEGNVIPPDSKDEDSEKLLPALYTVKKGDTLQSISIYFYKDEQKYKDIMEFNKIKDPTKIQIDQVLEIPKLD